MERDIKIIVSEAEIDQNNDYDNECNCILRVDQQVYSFEELLQEVWFLEILQDNGFYSKDDLSAPIEYLNNFAYEYRYSDNSCKMITDNINQIREYNNITKVFQEVVGPERIAAYAKWKKNRDKYLESESKRLKKVIDARTAAQEKKKAKKLAQAKALLEQEGVIK